MKCETCKNYIFYLWFEEDGSSRKINSCIYYDIQDKENCTLYQEEGTEYEENTPLQ